MIKKVVLHKKNVADIDAVVWASNRNKNGDRCIICAEGLRMWFDLPLGITKLTFCVSDKPVEGAVESSRSWGYSKVGYTNKLVYVEFGNWLDNALGLTDLDEPARYEPTRYWSWVEYDAQRESK